MLTNTNKYNIMLTNTNINKMKIKNETNPGGDRTHNLLLRRQSPYPFGHRVIIIKTDTIVFNVQNVAHSRRLGRNTPIPPGPK